MSSVTSIVWRQPKNPYLRGYLEHCFHVRGALTQAIHEWLTADNASHGEWRMQPLETWAVIVRKTGKPVTPWRAVEDIKFQIWANPYDPAAINRVNSHIMQFKLAWDAPELNVQWEQH